MPLVLGVCVLGWRKKRYVGHSLGLFLKARRHRSSPWVHLPQVFQALALALLFICLLNPVLPVAVRQVTSQGLNLVMVVDLSSSMQEYINPEAYRGSTSWLMAPETKLEAVKKVITEMISRRDGDRLGLVVFSENAYVASPLTVDYDYARQYVSFLDYQTLLGEGQTAIGEGIYTAAALLTSQTRESRVPGVIIVFTDGENNYGRDPLGSLAHAQKKGYKVYMVGVQIWSLTQAEQLIQAVRATGGRYFDVKDEKQLRTASRTISGLERKLLTTKQLVRNAPNYFPFGLGAVIFLALAVCVKAIPYFVEVT